MSVTDIGDLSTSGALREIDATGLTAVPDSGYETGSLIDLPDSPVQRLVRWWLLAAAVMIIAARLILLIAVPR